MSDSTCVCGAILDLRHRFCPQCSHPLAQVGIQFELRGLWRRVFTALQPEMNHPTLQLSRITPLQPGEEILGYCTFEYDGDQTPEERAKIRDEMRQYFEIHDPKTAAYMEKHESTESTVAAFEILRLSVNQHFHTQVILGQFIQSLELTSHRLILNGWWSIWWSQLKSVEAVTRANPESEFPGVTTLHFEYNFHPWVGEEENSGYYELEIRETVAYRLLLDESEPSAVMQLIMLLERIQRSLKSSAQ